MILIGGTGLLKEDLPLSQVLDYQVHEAGDAVLGIKMKTAAQGPQCMKIYLQEELRTEYTITPETETKLVYFKDDEELLKLLGSPVKKKEAPVEEEQKLQEEKAAKERQEKERIEKERLEAERLERLEAERIEKERLEAERLERLEQERLEKERLGRLEQERLEKERLERLEQERLEAERKEQERLERLEQERLEKERLGRLEQERLEAERKEKERLEAERKEAERKEKERLEQERLEQERKEAERKEKERLEQERLEQERLERLEQERLEQERLERLEQERLEQERLEQERLEQERLEQERLEQERLEQERLEQERLEQERLEQERLERLEQERLERLEQERLERLEQERLEKERLERLEQERLEQERLERLEQERLLEEERVAVERVEEEKAKELSPEIDVGNVELFTTPKDEDASVLARRLEDYEQIIKQKDIMLEEKEREIEENYRVQESLMRETRIRYEEQLREEREGREKAESRVRGLSIDPRDVELAKFGRYAEGGESKMLREGFTDMEKRKLGTLRSKHTVIAVGPGGTFLDMLDEMDKGLLALGETMLFVDLSNDTTFSFKLNMQVKPGESTINMLKDDKPIKEIVKTKYRAEYMPASIYDDITLLTVDWATKIREIDDYAKGRPVIYLVNNIQSFPMKYTISKLSSLMNMWVFTKGVPISVIMTALTVRKIPQERYKMVIFEYQEVTSLEGIIGQLGLREVRKYKPGDKVRWSELDVL